MRATHRLEQGIRALFAFANPPDLTLARQHLNAKELAAFTAMTRSEQLHSLQVLRAVLRQSTIAPPALTVAALLHDVGKSRYPLALWQRTLAVIVSRLLPPLAARLSRDAKLSLCCAPFTILERHPQWSGEILRACGSNAIAVWLAEHHQDKPERWRSHPHYALLLRLQTADDSS